MDDDLDRYRKRFELELRAAEEAEAHTQAHREREQTYENAWQGVFATLMQLESNPDFSVNLETLEELARQISVWDRMPWLVEMADNFRDQLERGLDTPTRSRRPELWFVKVLLCLSKSPPERELAAQLISEIRRPGFCPLSLVGIADNVKIYVRDHLASMEEIHKQKLAEGPSRLVKETVSNTPDSVPASTNVDNLKPFSGGKLLFLSDRVELCGVDICSGPRSRSRRVVLELLSQKRPDGSFVAYSGVELEAKGKEACAQGSAAGWIRDLRDVITELLRNRAGIACGKKDVVLSGDVGYRLSDRLTVQFIDTGPADDDVINDIGVSDIHGNGDIKDISDISNMEGKRESGEAETKAIETVDHLGDTVADRRAWILEQLRCGVRLKLPDVMNQFNRTRRTAQRDLDALRVLKKIEFVGDSRTGYYKLRTTDKDPGEFSRISE